MTDDGQGSASAGSVPDIAALTQLLTDQIQASEARERNLTQLVQQTLQALPSGSVQSVSSPQPKPVSADRPLLVSSATLADFAAWVELWQDFSQCQQLSSQSRGDTCVSPLSVFRRGHQMFSS